MEANDSKVADADGSGEDVVYVKERPFVKLLVGSVAAIAGAVAFLFILGLLMGMVGIRTPTFDKQIIQDQWDKTLNDPATSYSDCVEKGGNIMESFPQQCSYLDDTFTQSLAEACSDKDPSATKPEDPCFEILRPAANTAYETGQRAAELYEDSKDVGGAFIDGFKESLESE